MCTLAGPDASVAFTHLSSAAAAALTTALPSAASEPRPARAACHEEGVLALMQAQGIARDRVCLLDPKAPLALSPSDDGFTWFLFGGILGDDPPRDRTAELRALGFPTRHLGSVQMTTDTALGVTKCVVEDRVPLEQIPYVDYPTIRFNTHESVEMPFRYMISPGTKDEPLLPPGMKAHLHAELNESIDFE